MSDRRSVLRLTEEDWSIIQWCYCAPAALAIVTICALFLCWTDWELRNWMGHL